MSTIPPNWLGGIIQTQGAQTRAVGERDREHAAQTEQTSDAFADKLQTAIENAGRDSQVYSDAEGSGGQGRPSEGAPAEDAKSPPEENDADTDGGLDLQA
jgi:hypothetical protein